MRSLLLLGVLLNCIASRPNLGTNTTEIINGNATGNGTRTTGPIHLHSDGIVWVPLKWTGVIDDTGEKYSFYGTLDVNGPIAWLCRSLNLTCCSSGSRTSGSADQPQLHNGPLLKQLSWHDGKSK
jgi:hypothetical protein